MNGIFFVLVLQVKPTADLTPDHEDLISYLSSFALPGTERWCQPPAGTFSVVRDAIIDFKRYFT